MAYIEEKLMCQQGRTGLIPGEPENECEQVATVVAVACLNQTILLCRPHGLMLGKPTGLDCDVDVAFSGADALVIGVTNIYKGDL